MNTGSRTVVYPVKDIGAGGLIASVKDGGGNSIGLIQSP
jgi:hypothetical protein